MEHESKSAAAPVPASRRFPEPGFVLRSVRDQIVDFLDGKTHGEDLLHALYDRVLDEAVPQRMRALFRATPERGA